MRGRGSSAPEIKRREDLVDRPVCIYSWQFHRGKNRINPEFRIFRLSDFLSKESQPQNAVIRVFCWCGLS